MLALKIILCILALIGAFGINLCLSESFRRVTTIIVSAITTILTIAFCVLIVTTHWNYFAIPKILLNLTILIGIVFHDLSDYYDEFGWFYVGILVTIIAYIIAGFMWLDNWAHNFENPDTPEITTTSQEIMCARDSFAVNGRVQGGVFYVSGSVSEKPVYRYYYQLNDGGVKLGTIDANSTTIYFIEEDDVPHLDTMVYTYYIINHNKEPAAKEINKTETRYELYVPKGSVISVYKFDAE